MPLDEQTRFDRVERTTYETENRVESLEKRMSTLEDALTRKTGELERAILGDRYSGGRPVRDMISDIEMRLIQMEIQNQRLKWIAAGFMAGGTGLGAFIAQYFGL